MLTFTIVRGTEIVFRDDAEHGRLGVSLLRTLRLPDDGVRYPLPPGMGPLPVRRVSDLAGRVPPSWLTRPGVVVPMYRCEAIWLMFSADHPLPHAVKVGCGGINALSGRPLSRRLERPVQPGLWRRALGALPAQDYAVCPPQQFIDGFNTGHHSVRQFVAVPLGEGRTVEAQLTGREQHGGIQLCVYPPRRELEAALTSAGRPALPGLAPVTAGGSAPEPDALAWEWSGPGDAAPPPMPAMPLQPLQPGFAPASMHGTTVDLVGPAGSPDGAHAATVDVLGPAATVDVFGPAGSPNGAHAATVDVLGPAGSPGGAHAATVDVLGPAGSPDGAHATRVDVVPPVMDLPARPSPRPFSNTLRGPAVSPQRAGAPSMTRDEAAHTVHGHAAGTGYDPPPGARPAMPAPARDPLVGTVVDGRFEIQARIGEGRMGVVYRARELSIDRIDRIIALKLYRPQLAGDPTWIQRFLKEAKAWSRLQHPNTTHVFDAGQTSAGRLFVTRELVDGVSLRAALSNGPLAPLRVVKILIQCCASLAEAHAIGTLHRNIKPDNVFLLDLAGSPDFVKLLGFSVARLVDRDPRSVAAGAALGTPHYLSPEQARGLLVDARSDLFALGILAFELLTGTVPEQPIHRLAGAPAMPDTVPYVVQQIVRRALEKNPDHRYQSAGEVMQDCQLVFGDITEIGPQVPMPREPPPLPDEGAVTSPGWPMVTIVIEQAGREPRRMVFDKREVTIGRVHGNDIVLPDGSVSKRHARIVRKAGKLVMVDLKSTHGTYVNGRRISSPIVVHPADKIFIHDFIISVDEAESTEGDQDWGLASPPAERAPAPRPPRPIVAQAMPLSARPTEDAIDDEPAAAMPTTRRAQPALFGGPSSRGAPTVMAAMPLPAMPAPAMPAPAMPAPAMPAPAMMNMRTMIVPETASPAVPPQAIPRSGMAQGAGRAGAPAPAMSPPRGMGGVSAPAIPPPPPPPPAAGGMPAPGTMPTLGMPPRGMSPSAMSPSAMSPSAMPPSPMSPSAMPPSAMPPPAYAPGPAFPVAAAQPQLATTLTASAGPPVAARRPASTGALVQPVADRPMGLGAGGQISQRIYADVYGIETWDEAACTELFIHIVSPKDWYAMTGEPPPPTPVTFRAYQAAGLPWFQIYDEALTGIGPSPELEQIRTVDAFDRRR